MVGTTLNWKDDLEGWLKPFLARLGHKARRRMCPLYVADGAVLHFIQFAVIPYAGIGASGRRDPQPPLGRAI
jgi:hypothetical protein